MAEGNGKVAVPGKEKKGWKGGNVTFRRVVLVNGDCTEYRVPYLPTYLTYGVRVLVLVPLGVP